MSDHLARHLLEEMLVEDAREAHTAEARAHLAACELCTRRLRNVEHSRAQHVLEHPAAHFAQLVRATAATRQRPRAPRQLPFRWLALGGALAVMAVVFALRLPSNPSIRYRGSGVEWQVYVRSGIGIRPLQEGEALSAGTQLAFTYTLGKPQHLLLLGIDDAGTVTRYFPDGSIAHSSALMSGTRRQLPIGVELDAQRGRERLIALFSEAALDEARARAEVTSAWQKARAHGKDMTEQFEVALPAMQMSLWFEKP